MSDLNDRNTRTAARQAHERVSTFVRYFADQGATWDEFGPAGSDDWTEMLKNDLVMLMMGVEGRLQERYAVEPTEFGT